MVVRVDVACIVVWCIINSERETRETKRGRDKEGRRRQRRSEEERETKQTSGNIVITWRRDITFGGKVESAAFLRDFSASMSPF